MIAKMFVFSNFTNKISKTKTKTKEEKKRERYNKIIIITREIRWRHETKAWEVAQEYLETHFNAIMKAWVSEKIKNYMKWVSEKSLKRHVTTLRNYWVTWV